MPLKKALLLVAVFGSGALVGGVAGFLLNDYLERGDPDLVQEIQQQFETQSDLELLFEQQQHAAQRQREGTAAREGTAESP